ncbi:MAG: peptide-methionine (R)-S-oxide reductase, partial [Planctomycetota bacterium]
MRRTLPLLLTALLAGCSQPGDSDSSRAGARVSTEGGAAGTPLLPGLPGAAEECDECVSEAVAESALPASEAEWKAKLTSEQFYILRRGGTERAYSGAYLKHWEDGVYHCAGCDHPLYDSKTKYDACGWPSFWDA